MPLAFFQSKFGQSAIDAENGVLTGVKIMQLGKRAYFASVDGEQHEVTITRAHIEALLRNAGNRAVPIHLTHEWADAQGKPNADSVEMNARIGAMKNFRKDTVGDLIGDAFLKAGSTREAIIFGAEHNPEDNMISAVFDYSKDDPNFLPTNFRAADVVPQGAAVTALFQESKPSMDIQELITLLDDPKAKDAIKAIVKSHQDPAEDTNAAAMEADAGVSDSDRKESDKNTPAMMRAMLRISRSVRRQISELGIVAKSLGETKTAMLEEAKTTAKTEATALLGSKQFITKADLDNTGSDDEAEQFITSQLAAGCPNRATAVLRMQKDKPAIFAKFRGYKLNA